VSERDILLRVALGTLVALAAAWFLLISPKRHEASKQSSRVTSAQTALSQAQQKLSAGLAAKKQAPENGRVLAQLNAALPDSAGAAALLRELNGTSNHDNVAFRTATVASAGSPAVAGAGPALPPGTTIGPGGLPTLPLSLTFDGRYLKLTSLLDRLRNFVQLKGQNVVVNGRLMSVEGFQLSHADPASPTVVASLAATAYLAPLPAAAAPAAATATGTASPAAPTATSSTGTTTTASAGATP
jgi:hypothetical protein